MRGAASRTPERAWAVAVATAIAAASGCGGALDQCLDARACGPCMTCRDGACEPVAEPCEVVSACDGVTCGGHGACVDDAGAPRCDCSGGFHAVGLDCVADVPSVCVSTAGELQAALAAAEANGKDDVIHVVRGTYTGVFVYYSTEASALTVEGGYGSGCAERLVDAANTVLSAAKSGGVLSLVSPAAADFVVDGLTLRDGLATYGGGLYVATSGDATVTRMAITANRAGQGGGLFVKGANLVTVADSTVSDNDFGSFDGDGGGMNLSEVTAAVVSRNVITGNVADGGGGGVFVGAEFAGTTDVADVTLTRNRISGNRAGWGGGVSVERSVFTGAIAQVTIANNVITGNVAQGYAGYEGSAGGGVRIENATHVALLENTIVSNTASQEAGGVRLVLEENTFSADLYNNIVWGNGATTKANDLGIANDFDGDGVRSTVNLLCNDFDRTSPTGFAVDLPMAIDGSNLADVDPGFTNAAAGDYTLAAGSRCIDACPRNGVPTEDRVGDPRPRGTAYDMGALEAPP